jgi:hypothetical protein
MGRTAGQSLPAPLLPTLNAGPHTPVGRVELGWGTGAFDTRVGRERFGPSTSAPWSFTPPRIGEGEAIGFSAAGRSWDGALYPQLSSVRAFDHGPHIKIGRAGSAAFCVHKGAFGAFQVFELEANPHARLDVARPGFASQGTPAARIAQIYASEVGIQPLVMV